MLRPALLLLGIALACAPAAPAQVTPVTVPAGRVRFDFTGRFDSFDWRWNDGSREEWAADFDGLALDRAALPAIADAETRLRRITGLTDVSLELGRTRATQLMNLGTMGIGAAVGVTRRLTLFASVPFVRVRARTRVALDTAGSTAGLNPADPVLGTAGGIALAETFFNQLRGAITALGARLAAGDFDADPALKALAQQTLARAQGLEVELLDLLRRPETASPFLPRTGTAAAAALTQVVRDLQAVFSTSFGIASFATLPPLPAAGLGGGELAAYLSNPPIAARPFDDVPELTYLGDVEVGAAVLLVDRFPSARAGRGVRSAVQATVRLPTAQLDDPDRFLDLGTGDRQLDVEVALVTDVALGRFGVRLDGGYTLQTAGTQQRRVAGAGILAPASTRALLRRDPGEVIRLGAQPFVRVAPHFWLGATAEYRRQGADGYDWAEGQDPVPGVDPSVLAAGSRSDALQLGAALTFSHSGLDRFGATRLPLDATIHYQRVASSTAGRVADSHVVQVQLRFYGRVW